MTEKVLPYDKSVVPQEQPWDCGPASCQVVLNSRGIIRTETDLIGQIGTTVNGTDYVGLIERVLDLIVPDARYTSVNMPDDPATADQKDQLWRKVVQRFRGQSAQDDGTSPNPDAVVDAKAELAERIRIKYSVGLLSATTRCVVGLAILSAFFDVALSQGSFGLPQIVISLFLGGLFPAVILVGLSSSIPAAEDAGDHAVGVPELIRWHSARSGVPGKSSFGLARLAVDR